MKSNRMVKLKTLQDYLTSEKYQLEKADLLVTHGIFSKGKEQLLKYYDKVEAYFDWSNNG